MPPMPPVPPLPPQRPVGPVKHKGRTLVAAPRDERKVRTEVDGVVYQGRRSVHMSGNKVWIDGQEVGVEVDNNGDPLPSAEIGAAPLPIAKVNHKGPWWLRLLSEVGRLIRWIAKGNP